MIDQLLIVHVQLSVKQPGRKSEIHHAHKLQSGSRESLVLHDERQVKKLFVDRCATGGQETQSVEVKGILIYLH